MKKLLIILILLPAITFGRKFYFSAAGNDNYTVTQAQNQATPWQTLRKITSLTTGTNGPSVFRAGDTICFKRGDVFYGNPNDTYSAAYWWNDRGTYFTAPSGTPENPIVITNYGDPAQPLPNWLHPRAYYPQSFWPYTREGRAIIQFAGVHDIIIDGIQSNDFRVPTTDKANPGYSGGWNIGQWTRGTSAVPRNSYRDTARRIDMVTRFIIRNCVFNNTMYGIQNFAGVDSKITNCTFTNFKSTADTAGVNDVGAGAIESVYGIRCEISNNYIKGAWGKSGRLSSTYGLLGVGIDMFNLYNSRICYNTFIDCNGAIEIGNIDEYDTTAGSQYDTVAFNKFINCEQMLYAHGTGVFAGNNHHFALWNNVVISNNKDRNIGIGFGADLYGDGQGFKPGTTQPWWFCRNPYSTWNVAPVSPTTTTVAGSNQVTVSSTAGIIVGSVAFIENDSLLGRNYQTVTVTGIVGNIVSLSVSATQSRSTNLILYYLPVSDQTWSLPFNASFSNYDGKRSFVQYSGDATKYGSNIDSMFDCRNNVLYWTTGVRAVYSDRTRMKRSGNVYYPIGAVRYATNLGGTLNYTGTGEQLISSGSLFADTSATYPENWDHHLTTPITGVAISGFTRDFDGNNLVNPPTVGVYQYIPPTSTLRAAATYSTVACNGGSTTVTVTATGGTPPYRGVGQFVTTAGAYGYTVTDNVGATSTTTGFISEPSMITVTPTVGSIQCNGGSATIAIAASGGTPPYTGTGTFTAYAGPYTYTVTDDNGCTKTITGTLTQPTLLNAAVVVGTITQNGGNTIATVTAAGGTAPYQYKLDDGNYQSSNTLIGVVAGQHVITTKDINGCTTTNTINVSQPGPANYRSRLYFINAQ